MRISCIPESMSKINKDELVKYLHLHPKVISMKKYFYSLLLITAVIIAGCNQPESKTVSPEAAPAVSATTDPATLTTVEWIDSSFDKGAVTEGEKIEIAYRFKNTGQNPLIIKDVRPSCGCTVAEKPLEPIAPGKEGVIKAIFNSENKQGLNHKTITVISNTQPESHSLKFTVTVNKKS